jgi:hypothetical protein
MLLLAALPRLTVPSISASVCNCLAHLCFRWLVRSTDVLTSKTCQQRLEPVHHIVGDEWAS